MSFLSKYALIPLNALQICRPFVGNHEKGERGYKHGFILLTKCGNLL